RAACLRFELELAQQPRAAHTARDEYPWRLEPHHLGLALECLAQQFAAEDSLRAWSDGCPGLAAAGAVDGHIPLREPLGRTQQVEDSRGGCANIDARAKTERHYKKSL